MVAALHILSIKVSGWKAIPHDNPVIIDFCDGSEHGRSCLITGPNESGKSSTFSALRYALFEIHDRGGQATSNWVNYYTDNSGEVAKVEVELLINGEKYTIIKQRRGANAKRVKNSSNCSQALAMTKHFSSAARKRMRRFWNSSVQEKGILAPTRRALNLGACWHGCLHHKEWIQSLQHDKAA